MFRSNQQYVPARSNEEASAIASFMNQVYMWMMVGVGLTGITAYAVAATPALVIAILQNKMLFWGLIIAQFGAVIALSAAVHRMSVTTASLVYTGYAVLTGVTFSTLFLVYTMESIASTFFVTAFAFGGLSLFGYTTKRDLGPVGQFCMIGLFGFIAIMLLGFFFPSMMGTTMQLTMATIGVLIFGGLTAYDTQRIKGMAFSFASSRETVTKGAISGALILYLDFINLFINLLRLLGDRR